MSAIKRTLALLVVLLCFASCSQSDPTPVAAETTPADTTSTTSDSTTASESETPTEKASETQDRVNIIATTSIWADVTKSVTCSANVEVTSLMPPGADPHSYEPSLGDRSDLAQADLVVANGGGLEGGLNSVLESLVEDGVKVVTFEELAKANNLVEIDDDHSDHDHDHDHDHSHDDHDSHDHDDHDHGDHDDHDHDDHDHDDHDHDDHDDHDHDDHDHDDHDDHDHDHSHGHDHGHDHHHHHGDHDPHYWMDPILVHDLIDPLVQAIGETDTSCAEDYKKQLLALDKEIKDTVAKLPEDQRKLVTNHHAFEYFADRYDFDVLGTVIPSTSDLAETNPAALEALAQAIKDAGVKAVFSEHQHSSTDSKALGERIGVPVLPLHTGALGPADSDAATYIDLIRSNTNMIVEGLSG